MKKKIRIILIVISSIIVLYSGYRIISRYLDGKRNKKISNEINENIKYSKKYDYESLKNIKVDFKKLKEENNDTIGYIRVNNTKIDYVVVQAKDNEYYLNHNFYKENNTFGWVFADYRNKFDGSDKNIIIYGHNTETDDMFTTLKNVLNEDWYDNKDNLYIPLITEEEKMIFKVFSIYTIEPEDYYIETDFIDNNFLSFVNIIKSRSIYDFKAKLKRSDKILTLSTCIDGGNKRIVLHAVRIYQ